MCMFGGWGKMSKICKYAFLKSKTVQVKKYPRLPCLPLLPQLTALK